MERPDTITIEVSETEELFADHVDLFVTIRGRSLFTGQEALKKARELSELVGALTDSGLPESDILLQGIQADVSSGLIGRQSSARYRLRIKCRRLEELADVLGLITSQKNTDLSQMVWRYDGQEAFEARLLEGCLAKSKRKAEQVAAALGVELLGVHDLEEQLVDRETIATPLPAAAAGPRTAFRAKAVTKEELGLSVSHSKQVTLNLSIQYRVGPLQAGGEED